MIFIADSYRRKKRFEFAITYKLKHDFNENNEQGESFKYLIGIATYNQYDNPLNVNARNFSITKSCFRRLIDHVQCETAGTLFG